jgi:hypothetical protein
VTFPTTGLKAYLTLLRIHPSTLVSLSTLQYSSNCNYWSPPKSFGGNWGWR